MKNSRSCERSLLKKPYFISPLIFSLFLLASCMGNHAAISVEEFEQHQESQWQWLYSLHEGMTPEEALAHVLSYEQYVFKYKEKGELFQYTQGQYPGTGTLFGLFFEDGRLTSLLLDQFVKDFGNCRFNLLSQDESWPLDKFQETASWIRLHNRLEGEYNDVGTAYTQSKNSREGSSTDEAVEIITHLPLAVVALPFYGLYKLAGGSSESPEQLKERVGQIELGVTTDKELARLLGTPYSKRGTEQREVWRYTSPDIIFGVVGGIVSWIESPLYGIPLNGVTIRRNNKCVPSD